MNGYQYCVYKFGIVIVTLILVVEPVKATMRAESLPFCKQKITRIQHRCLPKYSDLSIRFSKDYPEVNEIEIGRRFHIATVDWSYIRDKVFINAIHANDWSFQAALNAITSNQGCALKDSKIIQSRTILKIKEDI